MDIKVGGITLSTMKHALMQAKEGRKRILGKIYKRYSIFIFLNDDMFLLSFSMIVFYVYS